MYCKCWNLEEANGKTCERCGGQKPSSEEVQNQNYNVQLLDSFEYDDEHYYDVLDRCLEFESKYC